MRITASFLWQEISGISKPIFSILLAKGLNLPLGVGPTGRNLTTLPIFGECLWSGRQVWFYGFLKKPPATSGWWVKIQGREGVAISATRGTGQIGGGSGSTSRFGFPEVCLWGWFWLPGVGCSVGDHHPLFPDCSVIYWKFLDPCILNLKEWIDIMNSTLDLLEMEVVSRF